jgi:hypothetical protein
VLREYWRDPHYWAWWWRERVSTDVKIVAGVVAISLLAVGGYVASGPVDASASEPFQARASTVERLVTFRERGRMVTKPIRIVRTVAVRWETAYETQRLVNTVTMAGKVRTVPVMQRVVVTRDGGVQTVVRTLPGVTQTRTSVVTDQQTLINERVLTNERVVTETLPVTVRSTGTIVKTDTIIKTVTETRTETVPVTVVETVRETVPVTVPITVTVTLPLP